jgi:hypothetical protein
MEYLFDNENATTFELEHYEIKLKYKIIEKIYQFNKWYRLFVKTDIDFIEMMNIYHFKFEIDQCTTNVRILLSAFDMACSRMDDKNHLYACYNYIYNIICLMNHWTNWKDDYTKTFIQYLCIYKCFSGMDIFMKLSIIKMSTMPSVFSIICKENDHIDVLQKLLEYIPNKMLENHMTYIIINAISNIHTLQWVFQQWPHAANEINNNHILKAGLPGNLECLQLLLTLNPTVNVFDNVLLGPSYNNNMEILQLLFQYKPHLQFTVSNDICFKIYAKNCYNQTNDIRLANFIISKHPYKYALKKRDIGNYISFYVRTPEEEQRFRIKCQMLHISNVKERTNWLYRISDDVCRIIIGYV